MEPLKKIAEYLNDFNHQISTPANSTFKQPCASTITATTALSNGVARSTATAFERFPKLPKELRSMIWRLAANTARDVEVKTYSLMKRSEDARSDKSFILTTPFPPVLRVCSESRVVCIPLYSLHLRGYDGRDIVINPVAETLFLRFAKSSTGFGAIVLAAMTPFHVFGTLSDLRHVPREQYFRHESYFSIFPSTYPSKHANAAVELPTAFSKLHVGMAAIYDKDIATGSRRSRGILDSQEDLLVLRSFEENEIRTRPDVEYERITESLRRIDLGDIEDFKKLVRWDETWKILQDCLKRARLERA